MRPSRPSHTMAMKIAMLARIRWPQPQGSTNPANTIANVIPASRSPRLTASTSWKVVEG